MDEIRTLHLADEQLMRREGGNDNVSISLDAQGLRQATLITTAKWITQSRCVKAMPMGRYSASSSLLNVSSVASSSSSRISSSSSSGQHWVITGGVNEDAYDTNLCDAWDPNSNNWIRYASLNQSRARHASCVWGGILRVWNGMKRLTQNKLDHVNWEQLMITSCEELVNGKWQLFPSIPSSQHRSLDLCAVAVPRGVILCGGVDENERYVDNTSWLYQPWDQTYHLLEWSLPHPGAGGIMKVISDEHGNLYAVGVVKHRLTYWYMKAIDAVTLSPNAPPAPPSNVAAAEPIAPHAIDFDVDAMAKAIAASTDNMLTTTATGPTMPTNYKGITSKWIMSSATRSLWSPAIQVHLR
jgi:hypothetical protein